jgi:hypothetical protein
MRSAKRLSSFIVAGLLVAMTASIAPAVGGTHGSGTRRARPYRDLVRLPLATGPAQHSPPRWPGLKNNFEVLGHERFRSAAPEGDVFLYRNHAYVGSFGCPAPGVRIVRVSNPESPRRIAVAGGLSEVDYQDMAVARIGSRDILAVGAQPCGESGRGGGLALYNVTKPAKPRRVGFLRLPRYLGVHELDLTVREDGQALALLAVPFAEAESIFGQRDVGADLRIVDVTHPRDPVALTDWGIINDSSLPRANGVEEITTPAQGLGYFPFYFAHSFRAADDGQTAYASYWDAGELKFDISDPANPVLVGRTVYPVDADGNAHSLATYDAGGQRYILQNDEDFDPASPTTVTSSATGSSEFAGVEELWLRTKLSEEGPVTGEVFDAGDGCDPEDYMGAGDDIVLVDFVSEQPPCSKVRQMVLAGDAGVQRLVINVIGEDRPFVFPPSGRAIKRVREHAPELVVVEVSSLDDLAEQIRSAAGPVTMTLTPGTPSWGFLRVFSEAAASDDNADGVMEFDQIGKFDALPHVTGELRPPRGVWTIHNTEVNGARAYSSWYSHGIVALDISNPAAPSLVGQWVPPSNNQRQAFLGAGPASVWGVAVDAATGLIYASDMRTGLWILRPTGPAAPG